MALKLERVCLTRVIQPTLLVSLCVPHLVHLLCLVEVVRLVRVGDMICLLHTANPLGVVHLVHFVREEEQMEEQHQLEVHSLVVVKVF